MSQCWSLAGPVVTSKWSVVIVKPAGAADAEPAAAQSIANASTTSAAVFLRTPTARHAPRLRRSPRRSGRRALLRAAGEQEVRHLLRGVPHRHVAAVVQHD